MGIKVTIEYMDSAASAAGDTLSEAMYTALRLIEYVGVNGSINEVAAALVHQLSEEYECAWEREYVDDPQRKAIRQALRAMQIAANEFLNRIESYRSLESDRVTEDQEQPSWMARPSGPGMWVCISSDEGPLPFVVEVNADDIARGAPFFVARVFGPIPPDDEAEDKA